MIGGAVTGAAVGVPIAAPQSPVTPAVVDEALAPGGSLAVDKRVRTPVVPPRPDVVLLVDGTGSMQPTIDNVQANLSRITDRVRQEQPDSRFAVATYGDKIDGDRVFTVLQGLTDDLDAVQRGVDGLTADRGEYSPGPAEDWINALWQIGNGAGGQTVFREGASPVVVLVGDASSHDPSMDHSLTDAIDVLKDAGVRVIGVDVTTDLGDGLNGNGDNGNGPAQNREPTHDPDQATKVVEATGGKLFQNIDADQVADTVAQGLTNLPTNVSHETVSCDPALSVTLNPPSRRVTSGETAAFTETIKVADDAPQGMALSCTVQFLLDGKPPSGQTPVDVTPGREFRGDATPGREFRADGTHSRGLIGGVLGGPRSGSNGGDLGGPVDGGGASRSGDRSARVIGGVTTGGGSGDAGVADDPAPGSYQQRITITVKDVAAPVVTVDDRTVEASGANGVVIDFTATAEDAVDGTLPVTCDPASGSRFPVGTTEVTCTATDASGNTGTDTAVFTVAPPPVPNEADLAVTATVSPVPNYTGLTTRVGLTLTNAGPKTAKHVVLTTSWPRGKSTGKRTLTALSNCTRAKPCTIAPGGRVTVTQSAVYDSAVSGEVRASVTGSPRDPRLANNTATTRIRVLQPKLTVTPQVARPGDVVLARGKDFPPGRAVTLSWRPGITAAQSTVRVGGDGTFEAQVLVLRKDQLGPRTLRVDVRGLKRLTKPVLIVQRSLQPPDFAGQR
ncbi:VWA domain-containing protein [Streptomyces sp. RY43-2]|uniref:VWA domain-containing protein n=1 Tax=Streptomyces macrolidinus TaxID=2952607 RepID=A0ABT0ZBM8_9ACTN|nr:VWA domain-containing protein [Streptomyces macrolidinus]MCN9241163.1 VWA domain-containing protein [Streptomyces macrolidinus]